MILRFSCGVPKTDIEWVGGNADKGECSVRDGQTDL